MSQLISLRPSSPKPGPSIPAPPGSPRRTRICELHSPVPQRPWEQGQHSFASALEHQSAALERLHPHQLLKHPTVAAAPGRDVGPPMQPAPRLQPTAQGPWDVDEQQQARADKIFWGRAHIALPVAGALVGAALPTALNFTMQAVHRLAYLSEASASCPHAALGPAWGALGALGGVGGVIRHRNEARSQGVILHRTAVCTAQSFGLHAGIHLGSVLLAVTQMTQHVPPERVPTCRTDALRTLAVVQLLACAASYWLCMGAARLVRRASTQAR